MKRTLAVVILSLVLTPSLSGAVSLSRFLAPEVMEPGAPAPESPAPEATEPGGRVGNLLGDSDQPQESMTGWFVGPMIWKLYLDLSTLDPMTVDRGLDGFQDDPFVIGIMGGLIRNNWRFGGLFVTGAQAHYKVIDNVTAGARISLDAFGVFVDYEREYKSARAKKYYSRIPYLRYGWLVGGIAAHGQLGLEGEGKDTGNWSESTTLNIFNPYLGLWVSPFDWLWAQVELGYIFIMMEDMQFESNGVPLTDGPIGGGPQLGFKLVFGSNPNFKVKVAPPR